jgi:hypothetical protein
LRSGPLIKLVVDEHLPLFSPLSTGLFFIIPHLTFSETLVNTFVMIRMSYLLIPAAGLLALIFQVPQGYNDTIFPLSKHIQNLEFCQRWRLKLNSIEAPPIQMDTSKAQGIKKEAGSTGESQISHLLRYQREAKQLHRYIAIKKYRNRFTHLLHLIDRIEGRKEKALLYFEVCRSLRYFLDIPGFRTRKYLDKQTTLLSQAANAVLYAEKHPINKKTLQTESKRSLSVGPLGYFKMRTKPLTEVLCWDLSFLFDCTDHVAPTCQVFYEGKDVVFQPHIEGKIHNHLFQFTNKFSRRSKSIDLFTFWKFNLFMIMLGHNDLVPFNIAIKKRGIPVSWDNEYTFSGNITVYAAKNSSKMRFQLPFVNILLDYPQAYQSLSSFEQTQVKQLMQKWKTIQENLLLYLKHPYTKQTLSEGRMTAFFNRLNLLTDEILLDHIPILREYIKHQFPDVFIGTDEACRLVENVLENPVTPMSAVYFIHGCREWWWSLTDADQIEFNKWIEKNHLKH